MQRVDQHFHAIVLFHTTSIFTSAIHSFLGRIVAHIYWKPCGHGCMWKGKVIKHPASQLLSLLFGPPSHVETIISCLLDWKKTGLPWAWDLLEIPLCDPVSLWALQCFYKEVLLLQGPGLCRPSTHTCSISVCSGAEMCSAQSGVRAQAHCEPPLAVGLAAFSPLSESLPSWI